MSTAAISVSRQSSPRCRVGRIPFICQGGLLQRIFDIFVLTLNQVALITNHLSLVLLDLLDPTARYCQNLNLWRLYGGVRDVEKGCRCSGSDIAALGKGKIGI
jgi:hypothetical protein